MGQVPFQKQVAAAKPRLRLGFVVALLLAMAAGLVWVLVRAQPAPARVVETPSTNCSPLDAETRIADPKMSAIDRATCLAIAGKIDRARQALFAMSAGERSTAVQRIFNIAHPIADRGDDKSAGPIMALVVEMWPENYMAVFHAGMAELAQGHDVTARAQLERFLEMYPSPDVWRQRAEKGLADIAAKMPLEQRQTHFPE